MLGLSSLWTRLKDKDGPDNARPAAAPRKNTGRNLQRSFSIDKPDGFRFPASENMIGDQQSEQLLRVIKSFAPSQPTQNAAQFAGRGDILANVIAAIEEHRNHLVIFGGRGAGKTSLALAVCSIAQQVGYHTAYVSCSRESTLGSIFGSALSELSVRFDQNFDPRTEEADANLRFDALVPEGPLPPQALADVLSRIRGTRLLIVIDEFDRNEHPTLTRDLTEIMKVISDRAIPVQIVIVGVGDVVDNLVGEHTSIARVLYVVRLSNMSDNEIRDTLSVASRFAGVSMAPDVTESIVSISYGRPYIARLVGLKAAKMSLLRRSAVVEMQDFQDGTGELLGYLSSAGFGQVSQLIAGSPQHVPFFVAMLSCRRDSADRFSVANVLAALADRGSIYDTVEVVQRALDVISSPQFGLLNVNREGTTTYQFVDPRAELCVSILCSRALVRGNAKPGSSVERSMNSASA